MGMPYPVTARCLVPTFSPEGAQANRVRHVVAECIAADYDCNLDTHHNPLGKCVTMIFDNPQAACDMAVWLNEHSEIWGTL